MLSSLDRPPVSSLLTGLYAKAQEQRARRSDVKHSPARLREASLTAQERADTAVDRYMPVSPRAGRLLYSLVRAARPAVIVEFGMSFGISTLHLAAAVRENGTGHIYTTELNATKVATATQTFRDAGFDDAITVLDGDALETLGAVAGPIGLVFLDGWKDMYLPVIKLLEHRLSPGAVVLADNTDAAGAAPYLEYVRDPANGYTSFNFPDKQNDSMELSCRV